MNILTLVLAIYLVICLLDRLRQINWRTAIPEVMCLYLGLTLWTWSTIYNAVMARNEVLETMATVAVVGWMYLSSTKWKNGPPPSLLSKPADLGPPEVQ